MKNEIEERDIYTDLFEYKDWEDGDQSFMLFSGITMKKDFGPLKKDQSFMQIWFAPEKGICITYDDDGNETNKFSYRLTA